MSSAAMQANSMSIVDLKCMAGLMDPDRAQVGYSDERKGLFTRGERTGNGIEVPLQRVLACASALGQPTDVRIGWDPDDKTLRVWNAETGEFQDIRE